MDTTTEQDRTYEGPTRATGVDLVLDANEGPPSDIDISSLLAGVDGSLLRRYPDDGSLRRRIGDRYGVAPARVFVTCGGDEAIERVCRAFLGPGRWMLTHSPGFAMIPRSARMTGAEVESVRWLDGAFPVDAMVERVGRADLVTLVSPNNPTGLTIDTQTLRSVALAAHVRGAVTMIDLAYAEFSDEDPAGDLLDLDSAVIVRTFSKAYGLAGIRVGYLIVSEPLVEPISRVSPPFSVGSVSLALAEAALARGVNRSAIEAMRARRSRLNSAMERIGLTSVPSEANFVCARTTRARAIRDRLIARGISVRVLDDGDEDLLRISVPWDDEEQARLLAEIEALRTEEGQP